MSPNRRRGFTLIELLIVVVIIGILAAVAIPKFRNSKAKAFVASMKSDLRNLATAQEAYFYENAVYASDTSQINFRPSSGVEVEIVSASAAGWGARTTHPQAYPLRCALYVGTDAHRVAPATQDGLVTCDGF